MFVPDMLEASSHHAPMIFAQATQGGRSDGTERVIGICHLVNNLPQRSPSLDNSVDPVESAKAYFGNFERREVTGSTKVTMLTGSKHGMIEKYQDAYRYLPESGYFGKDRASFRVEIGGNKVKVVYYFQAVPFSGGGNLAIPENCGKRGYMWRISVEPSKYGA